MKSCWIVNSWQRLLCNPSYCVTMKSCWTISLLQWQWYHVELAYNSFFTGDGSWGIGKVDMEDTKTFESYEVMHKSVSFLLKVCVFLWHSFKKCRADHIRFLFLLDRRMFEMHKTIFKNMWHLCFLPLCHFR